MKKMGLSLLAAVLLTATGVSAHGSTDPKLAGGKNAQEVRSVRTLVPLHPSRYPEAIEEFVPIPTSLNMLTAPCAFVQWVVPDSVWQIGWRYGMPTRFEGARFGREAVFWRPYNLRDGFCNK